LKTTSSPLDLTDCRAVRAAANRWPTAWPSATPGSRVRALRGRAGCTSTRPASCGDAPLRQVTVG